MTVKKEFIPMSVHDLSTLIEGSLNLSREDVFAAIPAAMFDRLLQAFNDLRIKPTSAWTSDNYDLTGEGQEDNWELESGFRDIYIGDEYGIFQRDGYTNLGQPQCPELLELAQWGAPSLYFEIE